MRVLHLIILMCLFFIAACEWGIETDEPLPSSHAAQSEVMVIADGWVADLPYDLPKPGSYTLPKISNAAGGAVIGVDGNQLDLDTLLGDKIVLLTFFYSSCVDVNGCPLATAVFYKIKERFKENPKLADKIRLISISFDPEHDTPEVIRLYGAGFVGGEPEWVFLTTSSEAELLPITSKYGQLVIKEYDESGEYTGSMAHILRAFLIDRSKNIRQEYSVSFLHDELVSLDIHTLLIEDGIINQDVSEEWALN